ncbi:6-carboxytetrahydropterin synthase [Aquitalea magnusonii]|uniref:6-carboxy-5,6,7,8-tetrahydropterin synthase n=1 Tax=Aquitalea aquatica TaxID=3044273 RepID=A0A838XXA6_9NEIS|nr:6-carboxytetrahydropterin synthase [Aquitalea magnusonii]
MHASCLLAGGRFEAARRVPGDEDRLNGLHGHSFRALARADVTHIEQNELHSALARVLAPLDYADLNQQLAQCDDLSLAQHIKDALPCPAALLLQSTPQRGVMLENGTALYWIAARFEAAHHLPHVPAGHKCGRLHGHGFGVRIVANAQHCSQRQLEAAWAPLFLRLHQRYLNDIPGLENPTSEVIAAWLYSQLQSAGLQGLAWVEVRETHTAGSQFDGKRFRIWKEQRFESAVPFDSDGNYSGHSYLVRLMLTGSLDRTMGWLLDFGDVKDRFKPLYRQLDHNPLDKLAGVRDGHSQSVAEWIHAHLSPLVPELARIDLMDDEHSGVSLLFHDDMRWPLLQGE